jgi:hypothetical protein
VRVYPKQAQWTLHYPQPVLDTRLRRVYPKQAQWTLSATAPRRRESRRRRRGLDNKQELKGVGGTAEGRETS